MCFKICLVCNFLIINNPPPRFSEFKKFLSIFRRVNTVIFDSNSYAFCDVLVNCIEFILNATFTLYAILYYIYVTILIQFFSSFFFNWLSKLALVCCFSLAICFVYRIVNFPTFHISRVPILVGGSKKDSFSV